MKKTEAEEIVENCLDFFSSVNVTNLNLPPDIDPLINTENVEDTILKAKKEIYISSKH